VSEPLFVAARRNGTVESIHRVHAAVVRDGELVASAGEPGLVTFLRSSAKPIQALQLVRSRPDLDDRLVAIACASHRAEPAQIEAVRELLAAGGVTEDDLEVGLQEGRPPERIYHNCSGKHAGMLAVCRARDWPTAGYRLPDHALQQAIRAEITDAAGQAPATGVDHCSVVTFALPLERMADVFSRLGERDGADRILGAMRAHPELIGGEGSLDTQLMQSHSGWLAKGGAEGLLCGITADGAGFALKTEDGAFRALGPAVAAFFGLDDDFGREPVENSRGETVGEVACL
jgi:L-asparaginase II